MSKQSSIAILTDSGTDVPVEFARTHNIFTLPLSIQFSDGLYLDGVTITPEEVYRRLPHEIPKTSLPSSEGILHTLQQIRESGYDTLFIITISSALSGTFNLMRLTARDVPELDCRLIDTRNIGIGAGFTVMRAAEMIADGASADEIEAKLQELVKSTKVFFCLPTLEYLAKGGRIGRVTATVGSLLDVRPIISCNEDGIYYTVQKARGAVRALSATLQNAKDYAANHVFHLAIAHGGVPELAAHVEAQLAGLISSAKSYVRTQVSPALGVHTGPGLIGVGVQRLV
ncbi:DegV family protein [bacterium]|nr:DegV family protein [bacterium]MDD5918207.1 DegV family protein [bacterium]